MGWSNTANKSNEFELIQCLCGVWQYALKVHPTNQHTALLTLYTTLRTNGWCSCCCKLQAAREPRGWSWSWASKWCLVLVAFTTNNNDHNALSISNWFHNSKDIYVFFILPNVITPYYQHTNTAQLKCTKDIYIYIYIDREREWERELNTHSKGGCIPAG